MMTLFFAGRWRQSVLLLLLITIWLFTATPSAFAHAVLNDSLPKANQVLPTSPSELRMRFSEPAALGFSKVVVLSQSGQEVAVGDLQAASPDGTVVSATLPALSNGVYLVSWQALSTVDGHTTTGSFAFGIGVDQLSADLQQTTTTAQISLLSSLARWMTTLGIALLLGFFAFRLLVWTPILNDEEVSEQERLVDRQMGSYSLRLGWFAWLLLLIGLILTFVDQFKLYEQLRASGFSVWMETTFGGTWMRRVIVTVVLGFMLENIRHGQKRLNPSATHPWLWAGLGLSMLLALTSAMISHSAALPGDALYPMLSDFVHGVAAGLWAGGLPFLGLALWLTRSLPHPSRAWFNLNLNLNFSAVAGLAVGLLMISGGYLAWQHVGSWASLVGTTYGQILLGKVGLALITLLIAAINLLAIKPRLYRAFKEGAESLTEQVIPRFRRLVWGEAALALLILSAAGILINQQRGIDAPLRSDAAGSLTVEQQVDDLKVALTVQPAKLGPNRFSVALHDAQGQPVTDASEVSLRYTFLGQSIGAAEGVAVGQGDGRYELEGSYLSVVGPWQIEVAIRQPNIFDRFAPFRLDAAPSGAIRPQQQTAGWLDWAVQWLTLLGKGATGVLILLVALLWGVLAVRSTQQTWQTLLAGGLVMLSMMVGVWQLYDFFTIEYTPSKFIINPILPDAESIAIGEQLFNANCVPCHGPTGAGDGPLAKSLPRPPANFTNGHTASHTDGDLYGWIRDGIVKTPMPAFGEKFSIEETWHLVNYVRRLSYGGRSQ